MSAVPAECWSAVHAVRPGPRPMTAEDLWAIPRVGHPEPAPDGSGLVVPVTTYDVEANEGRSRLWLVPAAGGPPRPLTPADRSSAGPAFSPDGQRLAFTRKDERGRAQLHLLPLDGGESERLSDLPLGVFDPRWLPDGSGIVFAATLLAGHLTPEATAAEAARREKDPVKAQATEARVFRFWDTWLTTGEVPHLFVLDLATRALRDLTPESTAWFDWMEPSGQFDVSPDGREVAYCAILFDEARSLLHSAIFAVPVAGGLPRCLTADHHAGAVRPRYAPDGRALVYGRQEDPFFYADRVRLWRYDRATDVHAPWLADWPLSPAGWAFGPDGTLYFEAEEDARVSLFAWAGAGGPRRLLRGGAVEGAVPGRDGRLYFTLSTLVAPAEVHACGAEGGGLVRLTGFADEVRARYATGEVRERRFEGAGGETVQMFVVLPPGWEPGRRYPLVHLIHGGPHGVSEDGFRFRWNPHVFAAPGHVVAVVNFQGSTSWGQDFARRIQGAWGDRPFEDVMRATDVLVADGLADERRMAATGGSYGGYLVTWIAGHTDRFRCLVNHAGVFDTLADYAGDVTQGRARAFGGEPWEGLEGIDRMNPIRFTRGFTTPMLVIHGERDFRVPVTQGLECYGILKARGIPARLVHFPDEHHWILKPRNSLLWYREVLAWLARFLGGAG